jgi:hypothetical protein
VIVGESNAINSVKENIEKVSDKNVTVLIRGRVVQVKSCWLGLFTLGLKENIIKGIIAFQKTDIIYADLRLGEITDT